MMQNETNLNQKSHDSKPANKAKLKNLERKPTLENHDSMTQSEDLSFEKNPKKGSTAKGGKKVQKKPSFESEEYSYSFSDSESAEPVSAPKAPPPKSTPKVSYQKRQSFGEMWANLVY